LFVGGIPFEWTAAEVNQVFGCCGSIINSIVLTDKATGASKGAAMVRYADIAAAALAIQNFNGIAVPGSSRPLTVKYAEAKTQGTENNSNNTASISNTAAFRYSPYPQIAAAVRAITQQRQSSSHPLPPLTSPATNTIFTASPASVLELPKQYITPEESSNLHIYGLEPAITELNLYEVFAPFGAIASVKVAVDSATKKPKGYGFVQFARNADAAAAMAKLNGVLVGGKSWEVSYHKRK
jgi:RNA recognition motif-containing protein